MLRFDGKFPMVHPIIKIGCFLVQNCINSALKHSASNKETSTKFLKCLDLMASSQPCI